MKSMAFRVLCGVLSLSAALPAAAASSLGVEPLFLEVDPRSSAAIRVRNSSDKPLSVELTVQARSVDENGVQTRTEAEDDFILFPPQAAVPPNAVQVFRLQPVVRDLTQSSSYFVTVRQLPVKLDPKEGGGARLQVVFAFDSAVHVVPRGAEGNAEFVSVAPAEMTIAQETGEERIESDGTRTKLKKDVQVPALAVTLRNTGNKYLYLQNLDYAASGVNAAGQRVELPKWSVNDILRATPVTLVLPGATRTVKLPLAPGTVAADPSVKISPRVTG